MTIRHNSLFVDWLGYATLRVTDGETVVYLDPGRYGILSGEWEPDTAGIGHPPTQNYRPEDGDIVCVSHIHHYDPDAIERVADKDATFVAFESIKQRTSEHDLKSIDDLPYETIEVGLNDSLSIGSVDIWTTPAYNQVNGPHTHPDGTPYHPKGFGCGFMLEMSRTSVFWTGDTDLLPCLRTMDVSMLCLPIGGSSRMMNRNEAAELAVSIEPDLVLPIHYNTFSNLEADSREFAADIAKAGIPVVLDES